MEIFFFPFLFFSLSFFGLAFIRIEKRLENIDKNLTVFIDYFVKNRNV